MNIVYMKHAQGAGLQVGTDELGGLSVSRPQQIA